MHESITDQSVFDWLILPLLLARLSYISGIYVTVNEYI